MIFKSSGRRRRHPGTFRSVRVSGGDVINVTHNTTVAKVVHHVGRAEAVVSRQKSSHYSSESGQNQPDTSLVDGLRDVNGE